MRNSGLFIGMALLVVGIFFAGCATEARNTIEEMQAALVVCAPGPTVPGIDVSYYQGSKQGKVIDWDAVKASGVQFAYIRVSDGLHFLDPDFARNWAEAKRVGIKRGVYQFYRPQRDPLEQANLLINTVGPMDPGDLPPQLDLEAFDDVPPATIATNIGIWLNRIEQEYGKKPTIYSGFYFWKDRVQSDAYADYIFWVAAYGPVCPQVPPPWTSWGIWQYSSTGSIPGISGGVDVDVFNGDAAALDAFAGGMAECGDGFCNGGETAGTCAGDCPICQPVATSGERIIDNGDVCQELGGDLKYWREDTTVGYGGSLRWTYTIASDKSSNTCAWDLGFNASGRYRLDVYAPQPYARSMAAKYEIGHAGEVTTQIVNQSAADGWVSMGEYEFAQGGDQYVLVGDNTGEPNDQQIQLVCDALRVTPLDVDTDGDGNVAPVGPTSSGGDVSGACSVTQGSPRSEMPVQLLPFAALGWAFARRSRRTR